MFCSKCGQDVGDGVQICSACGNDLSSVVSGQNQGASQVVTVMPTGTAPLVMGLLGMFGGFIPIVKYITGLLSLLAIIIGISQRKKLSRAGLPTGKATAGIILGSIAVLITVISIVAIGALFSGNSRTSRINPITNSLPKEIQGTVWTNGSETVEFGKNKVKLNDDWHRVKEITIGNLSTNRMFTWVKFSDKYVVLQEWSNGTLRLSSLYNQGADADDYISDFMTPDRYEKFRLEVERLEKIIGGVWEGTLSFRPNNIDFLFLDANMTLDIFNYRRQFLAEANFTIINSRERFPKNTRGACIFNITETGGVYTFAFDRWITEPDGFGRISLEGSFNDNILNGTSSYYQGFMSGSGSGTFRVVRK